jgi:hypothetical protein
MRSQEVAMLKWLYYSAVALMLCVGGVAAQSQQQPAPSEQSGQATAPDHTVPPTGAAQPQAPQADQAKPAAVGPAQAATSSSMPTPAPGATRQTLPSTMSEANAAQDKLPIAAFQFPLSSEQRRMIVDSVGKMPDAQAASLKVTVSNELPANVEMLDFPGEVTRQLPEAAKYKYVRLQDRVLIVDPVNRTVVGDIAK